MGLSEIVWHAGGIIHRGCKGSGQQKAVAGADGGILYKSEVRGIVTNGPVRFKILRELQRRGLYPFSSSVSRCSCCFFSSSWLKGRLADLTRRTSTATPSLMQSPCCSNLRKISELIESIAVLACDFGSGRRVE